MNAPFDDIAMRWHTYADLEGLSEMMRAEARQSRQLGKPKILSKVILDIVQDPA